MDWYSKAKVWDSTVCPDTCVGAKPLDWEVSRTGRVITVVGARYRNAEFSGAFAVEERQTFANPMKGKQRVKVYCLWFGHRLKTTCPSILVDLATSKVKQSDGEEVVCNLGLRKRR